VVNLAFAGVGAAVHVLLTGYFFPVADIFSVLEIPDLIATSWFREIYVFWQKYCLYQDGEKVRCQMAKR